MSTILTTYIGVSGYCPHIDENVTLRGKYKIIDDHSAEFMLFTCPIFDNAKKHPYDQEECYKYLRPCSNMYSCPIASKFEKSITL